jgi:1-acyl-sn-glycerol-3-phosphate acyltransferase
VNPIRTFAAASILESFVIFGSAASLIPNRAARLTARLKLNRGIAKLLARAIGLRVDAPLTQKKTSAGRLILANHTSVLDAIAIATLEKAIFVTSRDMAESLPIRWLATIGGATLIERRNRQQRQTELANLEARLREGRTVVLFPEATSTDGSEILRFRNGLLQAAMTVPGVEVVPVCLQYRSIGGESVTRENRDRIFLYGEMSVLTHLIRIFTNPEVRLDAQYFAPFRASEYPDAAKLAAHAEFLVRSVYSPIR